MPRVLCTNIPPDKIRKGITGKIAVSTGELETLIFTRPKVGYTLNLAKENVLVLAPCSAGGLVECLCLSFTVSPAIT